MSMIELADAEAIIRLLATAADPTVEMELVDRKRQVLEGLGRLVGADVWIWLTSKINREIRGDAMALAVVDGGWLDERERAEVFRVIVHPELGPLITGPLYDCVIQQRSVVRSRAQIVGDDTWKCSPAGQIWRRAGFDDFIISVYPLGNDVISAVGMYRRVDKPAFVERDRVLGNLLFQQVDWLHRQGSNVPASKNVLELSPRERQVLLLLLGGDGRKQVAAKLQLSEHTVADYVKEIYRKHGVKSRAELLAKFIPASK